MEWLVNNARVVLEPEVNEKGAAMSIASVFDAVMPNASSASASSLALCCPSFASNTSAPAAQAHRHAAVATYFANPATVAYYATAHKATWQKSGTGSSLGK